MVMNNIKKESISVSEWECREIGEFAQIDTGNKNTEDRKEDGKYRFYVRSQTVERIDSYSFDGEAVLTAGDGVGVGKVVHYVNGKFDYHQRVYKISNFKGVDGKYFYHYFKNYFLYQILKYTAKSSVDSVRMEMISKMQIPLPQLSEQKAIATALSDMDDLILSLEKLISKKKMIKEGVMEELLTGKKRLDGYNEAWEEILIVDLCRILTKQTGFDYTNNIKPKLVNANKKGVIPFIQNKDFSGTRINYDTDYYIPENVADRFPNILLNERCLLISISGSIGNVGIFDNGKKSFIGGAIAVAKFYDEKKLEWVMYYLQSNIGQKMLMNNVKAGSHQNITLEDIRKMRILLPTIEEQNEIVKILNNLNNEIEKLERKLDKYKNIKIGMLEELLTGKRRLI